MPGGLSSIPGDLNVQGNCFVNGSLTVNGGAVPNADNAVDIGSFTVRFRNLFLAGALFLTAPKTNAAANYTVLATDNTVINTVASTLTLPAVATSTGRKLRVVTTTVAAVISATANVVPIIGGAASTAILAASAGKWADLECDGANWVITASN